MGLWRSWLAWESHNLQVLGSIPRRPSFFVSTRLVVLRGPRYSDFFASSRVCEDEKVGKFTFSYNTSTPAFSQRLVVRRGLMDRADRFLCTWPECGRTYGRAFKLAEHMRSHTNTRPYICSVEGCGKTFLRTGHLQRHLQTAHSDRRPFECGKCDKRFSLSHQLGRHERTHDEPRPYLCGMEGCEERFGRKVQLRRHKKVHNAEAVSKVYACGVEGCLVNFSKWTLVVKHRKEMHQPMISCSECGKEMKGGRHLQAHIRRVHARVKGNERFGCEICSRSFSSKNAVKVHRATVHEGRKPYCCDQCGKSFGHKHLLARHRRSHDPKDVVIPVDDQLIRQSQQEQVIERLTCVNYVIERQLTCPVDGCRKRFMRDYDVERHVESLHPEYNVKSQDDPSQ